MLKVKNASTGSMRVTSFVPVFHFYTAKGLLVFSDGTEIEHNLKMGYSLQNYLNGCVRYIFASLFFKE